MNDNGVKTNADVLADIANRKTRTEPDGTVVTHFHLDHLDSADLSSQVDTTPRQIVDWSGGTPIWEIISAAAPRVHVEETSDHPDY